VRVFQVPRLKARRPSTAWAEEVAGKIRAPRPVGRCDPRPV